MIGAEVICFTSSSCDGCAHRVWQPDQPYHLSSLHFRHRVFNDECAIEDPRAFGMHRDPVTARRLTTPMCPGRNWTDSHFSMLVKKTAPPSHTRNRLKIPFRRRSTTCSTVRNISKAFEKLRGFGSISKSLSKCRVRPDSCLVRFRLLSLVGSPNIGILRIASITIRISRTSSARTPDAEGEVLLLPILL